MVDDEVRRALHERLDRLLDSRSAIEVPVRNTLGSLFMNPSRSEVTDRAAAQALWYEGVEFARDLLGDAVRQAGIHRTYHHDRQQRQVLLGWLTSVLPLLNAPPLGTVLGMAPLSELTIFDVIDAVSALDAGEVQPLFVAKKGKNRRANRWSLARRKLEALAWKKRLLALGYGEKAANYEVTVAFGEQWDTMRRWKRQCEDILGKVHVQFELEFAGAPKDMYVKPRNALLGGWRPDPLEALKEAGRSYRAELNRSAELSKRKSREAGINKPPLRPDTTTG